MNPISRMEMCLSKLKDWALCPEAGNGMKEMHPCERAPNACSTWSKTYIEERWTNHSMYEAQVLRYEEI